MRIRSTALAWGVALGAASMPAGAQDLGEPLSAIDWLSDSIALPSEGPPAPATPSPTASAPEVLVAPLDAPVPDRAGLIDARRLGLQADLWGRSTAADLARLIAVMPEIETPTLRLLFRDLLLARLDPPVDAIADDSLFLARIDKLLAMAELGLADDLIAEAGAPDPTWFRRAFDIALLQGTETAACETIERTPDISPTFQARIFCLARNGNWEVAALTLGTAEALNLLEPDEEQLLLHFLDPELFEGEPLPIPPEQPSPLTFRLYEAVGERMDTETLPTAFAAADISQNVGWKTRLRATERLARAGVVPAEVLLAQFMSRKPAASGGIWDRVDAVQKLVYALDRNEPRAITTALPNAWAQMQSGGYAPTLAPWLARRLHSVDLGPGAHHDAFEIALMAGDMNLAQKYIGPSREDASLLALAEGRFGDIRDASPLVTSIKRALSGLPPSDRFLLLVEDNRPGEALLRAIAQLAEGPGGDPAAIGDSLALLSLLGLKPVADRIALELLLAEGLA